MDPVFSENGENLRSGRYEKSNSDRFLANRKLEKGNQPIKSDSAHRRRSGQEGRGRRDAVPAMQRIVECRKGSLSAASVRSKQKSLIETSLPGSRNRAGHHTEQKMNPCTSQGQFLQCTRAFVIIGSWLRQTIGSPAGTVQLLLRFFLRIVPSLRLSRTLISASMP